MSLADDPRPPLPDWVTDAYTVLSAQMTAAEDHECNDSVPAIDRDRAVAVLCASDELVLEREDAEYAIRRLLERGYFYAVDGELRVTLPSESPGTRDNRSSE